MKSLTHLSKVGLLYAVIMVLMLLSLSGCGSDATPTPAPTIPPTSVPATAPSLTTSVIPTTTTAIPTVLPATPTAAVTSTTSATTVAADPTITTGPAPAAQPVKAAWVKDGACYEIFIRSFADSNGDGIGDLQGLISKLDYLNDGNPNSSQSLGVNCIWLMPVSASPSYHGYDSTDFDLVNPDYGTNDDFKQLVQAAHKRGIHILIDFVLNHTSDQNPWFKDAASNPQSPYRNWYIFSPTNPGYKGPWGENVWYKNPYGNDYYYAIFDKSQPDLNYRNPAVTKQIYDITRFWLQDMDVDGFRLDAAKHLIEDGTTQQDTPETQAWLRDFQKYVTSVKPDAFTIGEVNVPSSLTKYYPDELDEYFEFDLATSFVNSAKTGSTSFVNLVKDANGQWPFQRWGSFLTNHDQNRIISQLGGDMGKMRVAATAYLTSPGLPFVYYGEEIGMQGYKPDPDLRSPMQWNGDALRGFTTGKPWEPFNSDTPITTNVQTESTDPTSLLSLYRQLIHTRLNTPALAQGDFTPLKTSDSSIAAYLRQSGDSNVLVVINMSDQPQAAVTLTLAQSSLKAGTYTPGLLVNTGTGSPNLPTFTAGQAGAISYALPDALPAQTGYIISLKP